ncbi:MAG: acyl-CoA dehydrogenase family protein, partial [Nitrospinota bacterium]|nr:acyl-CoA dehydrogenase family protein [Nitrospinota bacterium]
QGRRCLKEAAMTKLLASDAALQATAEAMQIHGGVGYMMESPIQRYYRDARLAPITEGTTEVQHVVIGREIGVPL